MRIFFKIFIPLLLSVLIFIIVYLVDTTFYNVPNFIKNFRTEREIGLIISLFLTGIFVNGLIKLNRGSCYFLTIGLLLSMPLFWGINGISAYLLRDYLELWGKSPLLAEFPVYWNIYSVFITFLSFISITFILLTVKSFIRIKNNVTIYIIWYSCIFFALVLSVYMMISENRYTYEPINVVKINSIFIVLSSLIVVFSIYISFKIKVYNCYSGLKKFIYLFFMLVTLAIGVLLPLSKLVYPVILMSGFTHGAFWSSIIIIDGFILGQLLVYLKDLFRKKEDINESYKLIYNFLKLLNKSEHVDCTSSLVKVFCEEVKKIYSIDLYFYARENDEQINISGSEGVTTESKESFTKAIGKLKNNLKVDRGDFYIIEDKKISNICGKLANSLLYIPVTFSGNNRFYTIFVDRRECFFRFVDFEILKNMYNQIKSIYLLLLRMGVCKDI